MHRALAELSLYIHEHLHSDTCGSVWVWGMYGMHRSDAADILEEFRNRALILDLFSNQPLIGHLSVAKVTQVLLGS